MIIHRSMEWPLSHTHLRSDFHIQTKIKKVTTGGRCDLGAWRNGLQLRFWPRSCKTLNIKLNEIYILHTVYHSGINFCEIYHQYISVVFNLPIMFFNSHSNLFKQLREIIVFVIVYLVKIKDSFVFHVIFLIYKKMLQESWRNKKGVPWTPECKNLIKIYTALELTK